MFGCAGRHSENRGVSSSTLQVNSRADLVTAHQKLDDAGIPHGEVTDLGDAGPRDPVLQRSRRSTPRVDRAAVLIAGTRRRSGERPRRDRPLARLGRGGSHPLGVLPVPAQVLRSRGARTRGGPADAHPDPPRPGAGRQDGRPCAARLHRAGGGDRFVGGGDLRRAQAHRDGRRPEHHPPPRRTSRDREGHRDPAAPRAHERHRRGGRRGRGATAAWPPPVSPASCAT